MSSFQWRMTRLAVMAVATVMSRGPLRDRPQPSFVQLRRAVELHLSVIFIGAGDGVDAEFPALCF